jgi:hypothetical protein
VSRGRTTGNYDAENWPRSSFRPTVIRTVRQDVALAVNVDVDVDVDVDECSLPYRHIRLSMAGRW